MRRRDEEGLTELHPRSVWAGGLRGAILAQREALPRGERGERQPLPRVEWGSVPRGGSSLWECKGRGAQLRRAGPGPEQAASRARSGAQDTLEALRSGPDGSRRRPGFFS